MLCTGALFWSLTLLYSGDFSVKVLVVFLGGGFGASGEGCAGGGPPGLASFLPWASASPKVGFFGPASRRLAILEKNHPQDSYESLGFVVCFCVRFLGFILRGSPLPKTRSPGNAFLRKMVVFLKIWPEKFGTLLDIFKTKTSRMARTFWKFPILLNKFRKTQVFSFVKSKFV